MSKLISPLIVLTKEFIELVLRKFKVMFVDKPDKRILSELHKDGLSTVNNFLSDQECSTLRSKIDYFLDNDENNVWSDSLGADKRLYFVNELDSDFDEFYKNKFIRRVLASYTGIKNPVGMLLAARIESVDGNVGSGGGWHRDSPITHQFKAICYLNDVSQDSGPFQYIKGSHLKTDVLASYIRRLFKFGQYRFTEAEIDNYLDKTRRVVTEFTAEKGTLAFSDTKGIHRGKPIDMGNRYVLFCYFWDSKIPEHFLKLRQKQVSNS